VWAQQQCITASRKASADTAANSVTSTDAGGANSLSCFRAALSALWLLCYEPVAAVQLIGEPHSLSHLVQWAKPTTATTATAVTRGTAAPATAVTDSAVVLSCLGCLKQCLLQSEGIAAVHSQCLQFAVLAVVCSVLKAPDSSSANSKRHHSSSSSSSVSVKAEAMQAVTSQVLREAAAVLFALQGTAELRAMARKVSCFSRTLYGRDHAPYSSV
jgi:hypothetical protein